MKVSDKGAALISAHEGVVLKAYADPTGTLTIGIGFTWASSAFRTWWGQNRPGQPFNSSSTMSRSEAIDCLRFLLDREYGPAVNAFLARPVAQHVFDGMVSVVYNCGPGSLKWRWATAIRDGDIAYGAHLLEDTAVSSKGRTLPGLIARRKDESELILHGDYSYGRPRAPQNPGVGDVLSRGDKGEHVGRLLMQLQELGYYKGVQDQVFGRGAESAVMQFQLDNALIADGIAGPKTQAAIRAKLAAKAAVGVWDEADDGPAVAPADKPKGVILEPPAAPKGKTSPVAALIAALILIIAGAIAALTGG